MSLLQSKLSLCLLLCAALLTRCSVIARDNTNDEAAPSCPSQPPAVIQGCTLVMAPSTLDNAGWGVYTLVDRPKGTAVAPGDLVIQVPDLVHPEGLKFMLHDYMWTSEETGGYYEGLHVSSVVAGLGMLGNGHDKDHNVLPFVPQVDEGGLTRLSSPGAGAISHYHNLTFYARRNVAAGDEILVNYGEGWFKERQEMGKIISDIGVPSRNVDWLMQNGYCLDNMISATSKIPHAGRGAIAKRNLQEGTIIAPVPVLPITKPEVMDLVRVRVDDTVQTSKQLLLNYCLGHKDSSLLLFPYSNAINFVNHAQIPNVRLQWSTRQGVLPDNATEWSLDRIKSMERSGLMMELVATRNIRAGEEILIDYGDEWVTAWDKHVEEWTPVPGAAHYSPSYVFEDAIRALRLEQELKEHPYPDNIFTSCFYRYSDHAQQVANNNDKNAVTTIKWKKTRGIFELGNLRPCKLLQRHQDKKLGTMFTVQIMNRYGLPKEQRLKSGQVHIISNVPRQAIRFSDKIYTTDQHLPNAFRHSIGIPDSIFPEQWKDLKRHDENISNEGAAKQEKANEM